MLITDAPASIAAAIWLPEAAHVIVFGSGTFSARAPGQTPTKPRPLMGAAATDAVAVPCEIVTGNLGIVVMWPPANSGCGAYSWASTSAISGLADVTAGGVSAGPAPMARRLWGGADSGSFGTDTGRASVLGCAYTSSPRQRSAAANARARARVST